MKNNITIESLQNALAAANVAYVARKGETANINKTGINPDIAGAAKLVAALTAPQLARINELVPNLPAAIKDATSTKKPLRTLQALLFSITGDGNFIKGSARTFFLEYLGLALAGAKTRDGLAYSATGKGNESTSDEVKVSQVKKIQKAFGAVGVSTEATQNSVAFSKGGIAEALGVARKDSRKGMPIVDLNAPVTIALDETIKTMTDGKIALIVAQATGKE